MLAKYDPNHQNVLRHAEQLIAYAQHAAPIVVKTGKSLVNFIGENTTILTPADAIMHFI